MINNINFDYFAPGSAFLHKPDNFSRVIDYFKSGDEFLCIKTTDNFTKGCYYKIVAVYQFSSVNDSFFSSDIIIYYLRDKLNRLVAILDCSLPEYKIDKRRQYLNLRYKDESYLPNLDNLLDFIFKQYIEKHNIKRHYYGGNDESVMFISEYNRGENFDKNFTTNKRGIIILVKHEK